MACVTRGPSSSPFAVALARATIDADLWWMQLGSAQAAGQLMAANASELPNLILVDAPVPAAREFLAVVKSDPRLKRLPVVVIADSSDEADARGCYELDANSYVAGPRDAATAVDLVESLVLFWLKVARLPEPAQAT